jgi:hypothetical protein
LAGPDGRGLGPPARPWVTAAARAGRDAGGRVRKHRTGCLFGDREPNPPILREPDRDCDCRGVLGRLALPGRGVGQHQSRELGRFGSGGHRHRNVYLSGRRPGTDLRRELCARSIQPDRLRLSPVGGPRAARVDISVIDPNGSGCHPRRAQPEPRVGSGRHRVRPRAAAQGCRARLPGVAHGERWQPSAAADGAPNSRLREGLRPTVFSTGGGVLLVQYEGRNIDQAWIVSVPSGRATALGPALTAASLLRDGSAALVDRGGFLNPPDHGVVESLPLGPGRPTGPAHILAVRGSEPSWNA